MAGSCALAALVLGAPAAAQAPARDEGSGATPEPKRTTRTPVVRLGAEWGTLSAPIDTAGRYRRPDGSASVTFRNDGTDRELIAGRFEVGAVSRLTTSARILARGSVVFGSSLVERQSLTVAGVPIAYDDQQMFFSLAGGVEFQFAKRALGLGLDFGWAGTWAAGQTVTPLELELARDSSSGPYGRFSVLGRIPSNSPYGAVLFAAVDGYLLTEAWGPSANGRWSFGALFEWDASR